MKVHVNGRTLKLGFEHRGNRVEGREGKTPEEIAVLQRKLKKARKTTTARLWEVGEEGELTELVSETVAHHHLDPYSKEEGRRFALRKLLRTARGLEDIKLATARKLMKKQVWRKVQEGGYAPSQLTREEAAAIWDCYARRKERQDG